MIRKSNEEGVQWLEFSHFSECNKLVHGIFLRHGGVSREEYSALNFSVSSGDHPEDVSRNRQRALKALGISTFVSLNQTHSNFIHEAKAGSEKKGDCLITNETQRGLLILHADCQAAIFYDPCLHVLANVHCGWRGNVQNIYGNTVNAMKIRYGSKPENLLVGISPSLGPQASEFIHYKKELPKDFYPFQFKPFYFDLWEISRWQLEKAGILSHHIEVAQICTYTNEKDFFSYRRCKKSGRHGTLVALL